MDSCKGCRNMSVDTKVNRKIVASQRGEYKVVFKGRLLAGYNIEQVVSNIAQLTKIPAEKIENKFFNGKVVIIRRAHDMAHAQKLQQLFTEAGLEVFILRDMKKEDNENNQQDELPHQGGLLDKQKQIQDFLLDNKKLIPDFVLEQKKPVLIAAVICVVLVLLFILI